MKKLLLIAVTLFTVQAQAQLTLEHTYTGSTMAFNLEGIGPKWAVTDVAGKRLNIYNEDHTLWKSVVLDVPADVTSFSIQLLSTKLFDLDGDIEFIQVYSQGSTYTAKFYDHNGNIWDSKTGYFSFSPFKFPSGWKILGYGLASGQYGVFGVPGQYLSVAKQGNTGNSTLFPNPMEEAATLSYTLPAGAKTATLNVYNSNGQQVRSYTVTSDFNNIQMERGDLPAGVYTYQISAPGYAPNAERFVIQ